jgi:hypothetical protein
MQIRRIANQTDAPGLRPHREGQSNPHSPVFSARQATRRILAGTLGPGSTIVGNLTFSESISATIPPDTHIDGSLLMLWMTGVKLGDGCTVSGSVDLSMSEVEHFPRRMVVGGDLFLMGATITNLPDDLKVGGLIHLGNHANQKLWDRVAEASLPTHEALFPARMHKDR